MMRRAFAQMVATVIALWCIFSVNVNFVDHTSTVAAMQIGEVQEIALPIVMYHSILKDSARAGKYVLSPDVLKRDLTYLQAQGYETVIVADLLAYVREGTPLPEKPVMITFDDGYYNNYVYAYPILRDMKMRGVISIIGSQTALFTENRQENPYWSHLTLERLREITKSGVFEVQNHSYDLHTYDVRRGCLRTRGENALSYRTFLEQDTTQTQMLLNKGGLPLPTCYTYPFGSLSKESEEILKGMGFSCTLGCEEGMNYVTREEQSLYQMKRYNRPSGVSTEEFMRKLLSQ